MEVQQVVSTSLNILSAMLCFQETQQSCVLMCNKDWNNSNAKSIVQENANLVILSSVTRTADLSLSFALLKEII